MTATPTTPKPDNYLELSDGTTTLGLVLCDGQGVPIAQGPWPWRQTGTPRTTLQTSVGDADYSSYKLPFTPAVMRDWSHGFGADDFELDKARYYDSEHLDTVHGDITMGPAATLGIVSGLGSQVIGAESTWHSISANWAYISKFTPLRTETIRQISVRVRFTGQTQGAIVVYSDSAGVPSTGNILTATFPLTTGTGSGQWITLPTALAVTAGTPVWVGVILYSVAWEIAATGTAGNVYGRTGAGAWSVVLSNKSIYAKMESLGMDTLPLMANYRGSMIVVLQGEDGGAPRLLMNGVHGFAKDNTGNLDRLLTDADMSWVTADDLVGSWIKIVAGPGFNEAQPWRLITGHTVNASGNYLTVDRPWAVTHTAGTEFAIVGSRQFNEITGHGITTKVHSVLVVDDVIYFGLGFSVAIRRGHWSTTWSWADEATAKGYYLIFCPDRQGKNKIWIAMATTSQVWNADTVAWNNNLTLSAPIQCGPNTSRITRLIAYGEPSVCWVLKEDGLGYIDFGIYQEVQNREIKAIASELNGRAACVFGVYLFFSLLNGGVERYYQSRLDDVGPNGGEGLPANQVGAISGMEPYPGGIWASSDAGAVGTSTILYYNQFGWHKVYTAALDGDRIRGIFMQPSPDPKAPGMLWFLEGGSLKHIHTSFAPRKLLPATYNPVADGTLTTAWVYTNFKEINKFIKSIRLFSEDLGSGNSVSIEYQVNTTGGAWVGCVSSFTTSPVQEVLVSSSYNVTGKRIRFRISMHWDTSRPMPRIKALSVETITRLPTTRGFSGSFLVTVQTPSIQGKKELVGGAGWTAEQIMAKLLTWANSDQAPAPLVLRSTDSSFDSLYVFIDPPALQVLGSQAGGTARRQPRYLINLNFQEA